MKYRTRQSYYLRTGPNSSLQLVLYIDPQHVHWMNDDVLSRMLLALKDRIPVQLQKELHQPQTSKAKQKNKVDVYRGTGYQIAFYFRKTSQKHVVLLKNRQFTSSRPAKPEPSPAPRQPQGRKRGREEEDDDVVVVKPEPGTEEEGLMDALHAPPLEDEEMKLGDEDEEQGDEKPVLKVNYHGYSIFSKSLVVVIEPYPPLAPHERAQPRQTPRETPQLSASVASEGYGARYGRQGSIFTRGRVGSETPSVRGSVAPRDESVAPSEAEGSMPPPPARKSGRGQQPLFRRESTGTESEAGTPAPGVPSGGLTGRDGGGPEEAEEVDGYRALREMSQRLANADDGEGSDESDLSGDERLEELLKRRSASVVPKEEVP